MGWAEMEALATALTRARNEQKLKKLKKLEEIRRFNIDHPIDATTHEVIFESEKQAKQVDPITYNAAYYVLNYLAPSKKKK